METNKIAQPSHPALQIVEDVARDYEKGIVGTGACATLRAMAESWADRLANNSPTTIILNDIDDVVKCLQEMRPELCRRLNPDLFANPALLSPAIFAEVHDDLNRNKASFNAAAWFAQATDKDIRALHDVDWGGNHEADVVAEFFVNKDAEVTAVFQFTHMVSDERNTIGFECHVDEDEALNWLEIHRTGLFAQLFCEDNDITLSEAVEEEIRGQWCWIDQMGNWSDSSFETIDDAARDAVRRFRIPG